MAIKSGNTKATEAIKKVTSIGSHVRRSKPKNKHKRRCWKRYRGQGR